MFRKITSLILAVVFIISLSGCATILKEKETQVKIDSEPQGAEIYKTVGGMFGNKRDKRIGRTPITLPLLNRNSIGLTFKKDGYEESNYTIKTELQGSWMVASFFCFIFPAFIDLVSGNANTLKDKEIKVVLEPVLSKQTEQINANK